MPSDDRRRLRHPCHSRLAGSLENLVGCAVVISHDRWFLDRLATHILAFEGDKRERLGQDADQPHRIKYPKLTK